MDRPPPFDAVAEQSVLGSVLIDNVFLADVRRVVSSSDFYTASHRYVFDALCELADSGTSIDTVTLGAHLRNSGKLDKAGGVMGISALIDAVAVPSRAAEYAKVVKDLSVRRRMIYTSQEIVASGFSGGDTVTDYVDTAFEMVSKVIEEHRGRIFTVPQLREVIDEAYQSIISGEDPRGLIKTGIAAFDYRFGGLWPEILTTLAGRPSMGKSTMAIPNIAVNVALSGKKVLIKSMEDSLFSVQCRILSRLTKIPLRRIKRRELSSAEKADLLGKTEIIKALPIWVDDRSSHTAEQIRQDALAHKNKYGLDLLIIDQLNQVSERKGRTLTESTTIKTRRIATIPKALGTPVLMLHQINRASKENKDKEPTMENLKQSGEIEEASRMVCFVHRPAYYTGDETTKNDLDLIIAKNTDGPTGKLPLHCDMPAMFIGEKENSQWPLTY